MERILLSSTDQVYFKEAWELYGAAFPKTERRSWAGQCRVLALPQYHCEVVVEEGMLIGILFWWGFEDLVFVEHFATRPQLRGKGYGKKILSHFQEGEKRPIILEVEPPEDELSERRIQFYGKLGFVVNPYPYIQPPLQEGCGPIPLNLMSWPTSISKMVVHHFVQDYHPLIYPRVGI